MSTPKVNVTEQSSQSIPILIVVTQTENSTTISAIWVSQSGSTPLGNLKLKNLTDMQPWAKQDSCGSRSKLKRKKGKPTFASIRCRTLKSLSAQLFFPESIRKKERNAITIRVG